MRVLLYKSRGSIGKIDKKQDALIGASCFRVSLRSYHGIIIAPSLLGNDAIATRFFRNIESFIGLHYYTFQCNAFYGFYLI